MLFPVESVPDGPRLNTKKALLLIDLQNEFTSPAGKLFVENTTTFVHKLPLLVDKFREQGQVIWTRTEYDKPQPTFSSESGGYTILLKQFLENRSSSGDGSGQAHAQGHQDGLSSTSYFPDTSISDREAFLAPHAGPPQTRCCLPDSPGSRYPSSLGNAIDKEKDWDQVKHGYSAFTHPDFLHRLRQQLITRLYICGSLSNISVHATVLDAVRHGLEVTIIEDCLGYREEYCHFEGVRHMADNMGANGTDYQELMDDLAGLLGDVVREEDFHTRFHVSMSASSNRPDLSRSSQRVADWVSNVDTHSTRSLTPPSEFDGNFANLAETKVNGGHESSQPNQSARRMIRPSTPELSPPRKRSTGDLEDLHEDRYSKLLHTGPARRASHDSYQPERVKAKIKVRRKQKPSSETSPRLAKSAVPSQPNSPGLPRNLPGVRETSAEPESPPQPTTNGGDMMPPLQEVKSNDNGTHSDGKQKKRMKSADWGSQHIGKGEAALIHSVLPADQADAAFHQLKTFVKWEKMYHRAGEVPRLVAVQGDTVGHGSSIPIYRHPADEIPELLPFDSTVNSLREACEKLAGHPLNHALIQWYRNSEDNISEHSDKTLDIVRGTTIVNLSLGAERTMTLRTKKSALPPSSDGTPSIRPSQRFPLVHNSLFMLDETANQHWLHSIRADKRLAAEKTAGELAFGGERISLTFRHIGTYLNVRDNTIWGQGATRKSANEAKAVLTGPDAEREGENMIRAFGQENHRSVDWNWDEWYGRGFDVVNFAPKEAHR